MKRTFFVAAVVLAASLSSQSAFAQTLKTVKDRGVLSCGVSQGLPGFSAPDDKGNWTGLDVDVCRAIAAAVFNDPTKVKFPARVEAIATTSHARCGSRAAAIKGLSTRTAGTLLTRLERPAVTTQSAGTFSRLRLPSAATVSM